MQAELFEWVVIPLMIFLARTTDVGLSTLRILFIGQGRRLLAASTGFFEAIIWLTVVSQAFQHLDNPLCYIAYGGGFAMGNVVGMMLEGKLRLGLQVARVIGAFDTAALEKRLRETDIGFTRLEGHGAQGPVAVLFTVVRRRDVTRLLALVEEVAPQAFVSIEDVRRVDSGVFPSPPTASPWPGWRLLRKGR